MRRSVVNTASNGKRCNRPFTLQNRVHPFENEALAEGRAASPVL
jgi:hypothetical protein